MKTTGRAGKLLAVLMMLSVLFIGNMTVNAAGTRMLAVAKTNAKKAKITWDKVADADRYLVYYAKCGDQFKKYAKVKGSKSSYTFKKISQKKAYKVKVVAQKKKDGKYVNVGASLSIHFVTTNNKLLTNPQKIDIRKKSVSLMEGDTAVPRTVVRKAEKGKNYIEDHVEKIRYFSSDTSVATVNALGMVTGKKAGKCIIYAVAVNGLYDSIAVTVKAEPKAAESAGSYTLSYALTGEIPDEVDLPQSETIAAGEKITAAKISVPEGYTFSGWKNVPETMPEKNVTLTGKISRKSYKLTIKYTGPSKNSVPAGYEEETVEYKYGEKVTLPRNAEKGYKFCGWDKTIKTMPAKDETVTGKWKKTYTLTYMVYQDSNMYDSQTQMTHVESRTQEFVEGESQKLLDPETLNIVKVNKFNMASNMWYPDGDFSYEDEYYWFHGWTEIYNGYGYVMPSPLPEDIYDMIDDLIKLRIEYDLKRLDIAGIKYDAEEFAKDPKYADDKLDELDDKLYDGPGLEDEISEKLSELWDEYFCDDETYNKYGKIIEKRNEIFDILDELMKKPLTEITLTEDKIFYGYFLNSKSEQSPS